MENIANQKIESKYLTNNKEVSKTGPVENNELFNIFLKNEGNIIDKWEHYFKIYNRHFSKYRGKEINILEIGVFKGGSLKMWQKYFGDKVKIYALDIDPATKAFEEENIKIYIGNQADTEFLKKLKEELPPLDIVIDDGGHTTKQQINSFLELYEKVKPNGIYLVEDLHTNYWANFIDTENRETFVNFAKRHIDSLNSWYYSGTGSLNRYSQHPLNRVGNVNVPEFAHVTHSICFYNSIIVFEKQENHEPFRLMTGKH